MDPSVIELPIYKALAKLYDNYNNVSLKSLYMYAPILISKKFHENLNHFMMIMQDPSVVEDHTDLSKKFHTYLDF